MKEGGITMWLVEHANKVIEKAVEELKKNGHEELALELQTLNLFLQDYFCTTHEGKTDPAYVEVEWDEAIAKLKKWSDRKALKYISQFPSKYDFLTNLIRTSQNAVDLALRFWAFWTLAVALDDDEEGRNEKACPGS